MNGLLNGTQVGKADLVEQRSTKRNDENATRTLTVIPEREP
jgi:hypothetical protein